MAVGIIAEFNPFHNGHKYLLQTVKKITNEPIIIVMSGSFVQRGGIAVTDKLSRARSALLGGADLVIELPASFSHNTAQKFAEGAILTLDACGIADRIAFGSESGDIDSIKTAADISANEPRSVSDKIKKAMSEGIPYPVARASAYGEYASVLSTPNDILAVEYIRACMVHNIDFMPIAIRRNGAGHDSCDVSGNIASATEIRRRILSGENADMYMPPQNFEIYDVSRIDTAVISNLRMISPQRLSDISEVCEGLENKFISAARDVSDVSSLCMSVKSKRYTLSKIRRIAYSSFIGLTKDISSLKPTYIRILGATQSGRALIKEMKTRAKLPVITKPADYHGDTLFNFNSRADDIFALCAVNESLRRAGNDLRITPVMNL